MTHHTTHHTTHRGMPVVLGTDAFDQDAIDAAQAAVLAHGAARSETERAHAAGLITLDTPDPEAFYVTGEAAPYRVSPVPDVTVGAQHAVKRGRNRKGATRKVVARGVPYVTGDARVSGPISDGNVSVPAFLLAAALDPDHTGTMVRRRRVGLNALDVTRVTDAAFGPFGLEPLIGTDAESWSEVIPGDRSTVHAMAPYAGHTHREATLSTRVVERVDHTGAVVLVDARAFHGAESTAQHRVRVRGPRVRIRKSEQAWIAPRPATRVTVRGWHGVPMAWRTLAPSHIVRRWTVTPCLAHADQPGMVWCGHTLRVRGGRRRNPARVVRRARTIGTVRQDIGTREGWEALAEMLAPGERVEVTSNGHAVTITRARRTGRYSSTIVTPDGTRHTVDGARTSTATARRILLTIG